jgi:hypothetical protein
LNKALISGAHHLVKSPWMAAREYRVLGFSARSRGGQISGHCFLVQLLIVDYVRFGNCIQYDDGYESIGGQA